MRPTKDAGSAPGWKPIRDLEDAAAELAAAQDALEAKLTLWQNAVEAARTAQAFRDEAYRVLQDRLREFGLNVLSVTRNHHDSDTFLRYFPDGYGQAIHAKAPQLAAFAEITLGNLAEETDPWLVRFRGRIATALDAFAKAQEVHVAAAGARQEAFAYLSAEKLAVDPGPEPRPAQGAGGLPVRLAVRAVAVPGGVRGA